MFTNFSILPLRAAILLGFAFSILGIGLGIYTLVEKFLNPNLPVGWAALLVTLSMFSGVQLIALGMIGEYLGRVFLSQNKKPQYTIRKRVDST
jgi:undecaprenyl-phosphate 4-deoxy-4-formamido-L-arabinose transferase